MQLVYQVKTVLLSLVAGGLVDLVSSKMSELALCLLAVCFFYVLDKRITDAAES